MKVNSKDKLLAYIAGLDEAQIEKVIAEIPQLIKFLNIQSTKLEEEE